MAGNNAAIGDENPLTMTGGTLDLGGNSVAVTTLTGDAASQITSSTGTGTLTVTVASGTSTFAGTIADGVGGGEAANLGSGRLSAGQLGSGSDSGTTPAANVVTFYLQPVNLGTTDYTTDFETDASGTITANSVETTASSGTIYLNVYASLSGDDGSQTSGIQFAELNFRSLGEIGDGSSPSSLGLTLADGFSNGPVASTGAAVDLNGDGNLDLGSTNNASDAGWAIFCQSTGVYATASGDGTGVFLGTLAYTYSNAGDGQTAQLTLDSPPAH